MRETLRHREAFEFYYSLGNRRTLVAVSRHDGSCVRAVAKWSVVFGWQDRVHQRDTENAKRLAAKTDAAVVSTKAQYRGIIRGAIDKWVEEFKLKKIEVDTVMDLERLVKLDLLLMGEATERSEHDISNLSDTELHSRLAGLLARYGQEGSLGSAPGTRTSAESPGLDGMDGGSSEN